MTGRLPAFEKECFFITPIGDEGSDTRRRADGVLEAIVEPAANTAGLTAVRADRIGEGGQVNLQVIEHVYRAATAVADLTGANLNVYYEVGMRHTTRLPLVLIADDAERDKLPFDILVQRTIFFSNDMNGVAACKAQVGEQIQGGLGGAIDSPIDAAVNIRQFQQGDAVERTLAELVTSVDGLSREVSRGGETSIAPAAVREVVLQLDALETLAESRQDPELMHICALLARPVDYMVRRSRLDDEEIERLRHRRLRQRRGLEGQRPLPNPPSLSPSLTQSSKSSKPSKDPKPKSSSGAKRVRSENTGKAKSRKPATDKTGGSSA